MGEVSLPEDRDTRPCGCRPGSSESGWHEVRSEACEQTERDVWMRLFARIPEVVAAVRARG